MEKNTTESVSASEIQYREQSETAEALYRLLCTIARWLKLDWQTREDIVHDIIVRVWSLLLEAEDLSDWEPDKRRRYLYASMDRHHRKVERRGNRLPLFDGTEAAYRYAIESIADDEAHEPYQVQVALLERNIKRRLKEFGEEILTDREFEIFEARLHGRSYKEIAAVMSRDENLNRDESINRHEKVCRQTMSRVIIPKMSQAFREKGFI
jgi:DNA-directed RNA polymerase specialized sigma24 family protein